MTQREIMVRAHQIARTLEGDYQARMVLALRQAWMEARLMKLGSRWQKDDMDRVYFNDLATWYGLELSQYKTGRIASAKLDGEHISNNQASKVSGRLSMAKVWYDVATKKFCGKNIDEESLKKIADGIREAARIA